MLIFSKCDQVNVYHNFKMEWNFNVILIMKFPTILSQTNCLNLFLLFIIISFLLIKWYFYMRILIFSIRDQIYHEIIRNNMKYWEYLLLRRIAVKSPNSTSSDSTSYLVIQYLTFARLDRKSSTVRLPPFVCSLPSVSARARLI